MTMVQDCPQKEREMAYTQQFKVSGMTCQNCVRHVTKALLAQQGVTRAEVSLEKGSAEIESSAPVDFSVLEAALKEEGYEASKDNDGQPEARARDPSASGEHPGQAISRSSLTQPPVPDKKPSPPAPEKKGLLPLDFSIEGMHCATCVFTIEKALGKQEGVSDVRVNLATSSCSLAYDPETVTPQKLFDTVENAGYTPIPPEDLANQNAFSREIRGVLLTASLTVALLFPLHGKSTGIWPWEQGFLGILLEIAGGGVFLRGAFNALKNRSANMDTLVSLGTLAALTYSLLALLGITPMTMFLTQGLLLFFIRLGKLLELSARNKAVSLLEGTTSLLPATALKVLPDGSVREFPIDSLIEGEKIQIPKGSRLPADGILDSDEGFFDEALITGESLPVRRIRGEQVTGGTANAGSPVRMTVLRTGTHTVLGRMVMAIRKAQNDRPPIQHLADRIAAVFVPVVIVIALLSFSLFALLTRDLTLSVNALIGVLMVACPCAMGLATPTAILVGSSAALRQGIIFRRGSALEIFSEATLIVFDKTGTLTTGAPEVTGWSGTEGETQIAPLLLPVISLATHPLSRAITKRLERLYPVDPTAKQEGSWTVTEIEGQGMRGVRGNDPRETLLLGRPEFLLASGIILPVETDTTEEGSVVAVAFGGKYLGQYHLKDGLRHEAASVVGYFSSQGIRSALLSGDHPSEALRVGRLSGIRDQDIYGGQTPEDKEAMIRKWKEAQEVVVMVGDGVNDAAAMARAHLGVAMGEGAAITRERGDLLLPPGGLYPLANGHHIARLTLARVRQNLWWAFGYNIIGIPMAAGVLYPLTHRFLPPSLDGLAMALSSVIVVGNSLLLSRKTRQPAVTTNP